MPVPSGELSPTQKRRLDGALQRRRDGREAVEREWSRVIADAIDSGVTVKALAQHLGVSRQAVYDWLKRAETR